MQKTGKLKKIFCCIAFVVVPSFCGAEGGRQEQIKPYIQVKPVAGDEYVVRAFFSPSCNFSKQYFPFFTNLSKTLPKDKRFEFTPVVNKRDGANYVLAFMAVKRFYPQYLHNFMEASFEGVQEYGIGTDNWAGIDRIGKASGIKVSLPKLVHDNIEILEKDSNELIVLQHSLGITNTPSVSVAGTYIVTPEFTYGDTQIFSQLVNGIISMTE